MKITQIKQQVKRPDRYSIYIDGVFAFGLSEAALLQSGLASGQELDSTMLTSLKDKAAEDKVYGNALRYVAMRLRSEWEVRTYLHRKGADEPRIDQIVERLTAVGLMGDTAFAKMWVANRRLLKPTSCRKLRQELAQKHVMPAIIDQVLSDIDNESESVESSDRQALREIVEKKRSRYPDQSKFMQYLARQGFAYDDIKFVLQDLPD